MVSSVEDMHGTRHVREPARSPLSRVSRLSVDRYSTKWMMMVLPGYGETKREVLAEAFFFSEKWF